MDFPPDISRQLKPGTMARAGEADGRWSLYLPNYDLACELGEEGGEGRLRPGDLESDGRCWEGRFNAEVYHLAGTFRAHRDGREANLETNYLCHYGCRHCFQSLAPAKDSRATPDFAAICAAAERLLAAGAEEISITGGDVFLHPDLWRLLDYLTEQAPRVTVRVLVSGGGLDWDDALTRRRLEKLAGRRVLVKSDFFGHNAKLHDDFTRVPGSFDKLVDSFGRLRELGVVCLATAALTRANFATRFELINFLFNLTEDHFSVGSVIYPSDYRRAEELDALRLSPEQVEELTSERFFAPLVGEYHSWEPQCAGDCQFSVASASGSCWGCSFLKLNGEVSDGRLPVVDSVSRWRARAVGLAQIDECPSCPARFTCRKCPSFLSSGKVNGTYCEPSRRTAEVLYGRVRQARERGFEFVHADVRDRFPAAVCQ